MDKLTNKEKALLTYKKLQERKKRKELEAKQREYSNKCYRYDRYDKWYKKDSRRKLSKKKMSL